MTQQIHRRQRACRVWGWVGLLLLTLLCIVASLTLGAKPLPLSAVWHYFSADDRNYHDLVIEARLPRTLIGLMAGAALALSGAVTQGLLRNPLGDPGLLGVNAGASAIIVSFAFFSCAGCYFSLLACIDRCRAGNPAVLSVKRRQT